MINKCIITLLLFTYSQLLFAGDFVSTKSNKINMRTGTGIHYPIKWVYIKKNIPLKVVEKFENWKKVCDINEDCGWIKSTLLSKKRYVMLKENTLGYTEQDIESKILMKIDKFAIMEVKTHTQDWCLLYASKRKAWVQKKFIWGID